MTEFNRGDTVRATRNLHRSRIQLGDRGTFVRYDTASTRWITGNDTRTPIAIVDFPGVPGAPVSLNAIRLVRPAEAEPSSLVDWAARMVGAADDVKARDLAHAHEKVAAAYKALAYALNDLKAVERR